jgi:hypothetical protein
MSTLPSHSLRKDDLRYILTESLPLRSQKPNSAALRTAKQWAIAANLMNDRGLTDEGRLVATKDPYLEATVTNWLIHFNLRNPDISNYYTTAYLLAKIWERDFQSASSVLVDRIIDMDLGLASVLGIDRDRLRQQLDILSENEIIEQRSSAPHLLGKKPLTKEEDELSYQVYPCWETPLDLLTKAYENDIATPNRPLIQSLAGILDDGDENVLDFSQFLEWAARLTVLDGGLNTFIRLVS